MAKKSNQGKEKSVMPSVGEAGRERAVRHQEHAERLAEEILILFSKPFDDAVLLMAGGTILGNDALPGLRVVANCMCQQNDWGTGALPLPRRASDIARLAEIRATLERLAARRDPWWVLCYHLGETDEWGMAWSRGLSVGVATDRLIACIRHDMDL